MASQQIPESYDSLVRLFEDAAAGARDHGTAVGLKQNTEAVLRPELEALTGTAAAPGLKSKWNAAKAYKVDMTAAFRSAKAAGRLLASACVNVLKLRFGGQWNSAWQTAGFTGGSLAIPDNPLTLLQQLRAYFAANPGHEVADLGTGLGATAAACDAAASAINSASAASNQSNVAAGTAKSQYDAGLRDARRRLMGLRDELAQFLGREDERWYAFGFDRPGDPETPEVPEHLVVTPGAPGSGLLFVDWDNARRAESYRVVVLGSVNGSVVTERLVAESEITLSGLAPGQTVRIVVTARNGKGGESAPAPVVVVTLP
jgi:hypothetical protein